MKHLVAALALALAPGTALACNPERAAPLMVTDTEFQEAAARFGDAATDRYGRLAAYETMLRVEGAAFGTILRDGYRSGDDDLIAAATYCEVMRSNGATARVAGPPDDAGDMSPQQEAQILTRAFPLRKSGADWDQGCLSTSEHPSEGCNPSYFISVRDGTVAFREDNQTGTFRWVDGEFVGRIDLYYGDPTYSVPATLSLF